MEKTETNQQLKLLLQIAKELIQEGKSNSFRDFSSKYLNRCSNYLGTLVYQNKSPSVASILTLYFKLNQEKYILFFFNIVNSQLANFINSCSCGHRNQRNVESPNFLPISYLFQKHIRIKKF